jgi:hypothetical protein
MHRGPKLHAVLLGSIAKGAMRSVVGWQRMPKIIWPIWIRRLIGHLAIVARRPEIFVAHARFVGLAAPRRRASTLDGAPTLKQADHEHYERNDQQNVDQIARNAKSESQSPHQQ